MITSVFGFQGGGTGGTTPLPPTLNYGLFAQTVSSTPVANTTTEGSLIGTGQGTLTVPPNIFKVGDSFMCSIAGHISSANNQRLTIQIRANAVVLVDTGLIRIDTSTGQHFQLNIHFTVRKIGVSGVAEIVTAGFFLYTKDASLTYEGDNFSTETNTGFDTTISNTLQVTAQWNASSPLNSIYSDICVLNKVF